MQQFEIAWYWFLATDYLAATRRLEEILSRLEQVPAAYREFVKRVIYRNLGLCYDLLGGRAKAVECYKKGEAECKNAGAADWFIKALYRDFKDRPYKK